MSNIIDRLFEDAKTQLPNDNPNNIPGWPATPSDDQESTKEFLGGDDDKLTPYSEYLNDTNVANSVANRIGGPSDIRAPSQKDREIIAGGIRANGFEAIAFYKSKRFIVSKPFPGKWGIFYIKQGLDEIAWEISNQYPGYSDTKKLARDFLYEHEHYHFQSDIQVLMFEVLLNKHLYAPLRRALRGKRSHFVEEALANKRAYEWAKGRNVGLKEFAYDFMSLQPNAYSRFEEPRNILAGEWLSNVIDLLPPGSNPRLDLASWVGAVPKDLMRASLCPEYVIYSQKLENWIDPAWNLPPVKTVVDDLKVIKKLKDPKESSLAKKWQITKSKLMSDRLLGGLGFKRWPKEGPNIYSVKVDDGFRAHLQDQGAGNWLAIKIGGHKEMGHG